MIDPQATPVDIDEQRKWLTDYRETTRLSWSQVSKRIGIPSGTLSQFGSEKGYSGNEQKVAEEIYKFRQLLTAQASIEVEAPDIPGYFETETSQQLSHMLSWAQRGKIVAAATGAGLGKSTTARHFAACYPNVFYTAMAPSTAGVNNMQVEVLEALGENNAVGTPQKLSRQIKERLENRSAPLLIVDEAQHLSSKALEEIRSWNDTVGCGIALFGNIKVIQQLEGGARASAFAQLFSRLSMRMTRPLPLNGDVDALAAGWGIEDTAVIDYLRKICMTPGGLRNGTHCLELASMLASSDRTPTAVAHLQDAWAQLSSRVVMA